MSECMRAYVAVSERHTHMYKQTHMCVCMHVYVRVCARACLFDAAAARGTSAHTDMHTPTHARMYV
jgi:hypothetical protein